MDVRDAGSGAVGPYAGGRRDAWPTRLGGPEAAAEVQGRSRTYNVMVPNLLSPFLGWGLGAPRSTVGLAMYVSSLMAGCAYCSAHSCSFALRR